MDLEITGRTALVVGGTGVLGTAISARLRAEGATVVTAGRTSGDVRMDAGDDRSVAEAVRSVVDAHGGVDLLVHAAAPAAGTLDPSRLSDPDAVGAGIAAKSLTFLRVANAVLPGMRQAGFGRVVGIGGQLAYTTGNVLGALRNVDLVVIAKNLADAAAGSGVTVNVVNPGTVTDHPAAEVETASGGQTSPEAVAALVAFLCSGLASTISGESIASGHKLLGIATTLGRPGHDRPPSGGQLTSGGSGSVVAPVTDNDRLDTTQHTFLVDAGRRPRTSDHVDRATRPATQTFPYLDPANPRPPQHH